MRIYLEYPWPGVREAPFIGQATEISRGEPITGGLRLYTDGWGNPLVYITPGRDHSTDGRETHGDDIGSWGKYDNSRRSGAYVAGEETRWAIDVYSAGSNEISEYP